VKAERIAPPARGHACARDARSMAANDRSGRSSGRMKVSGSSSGSGNSRTLYDVGIPMLALAWPLFWLSFVPVVLIEAEVAHRQLGIDRKKALIVSATANALSTMVGIPVVWLGLVLVEFAVGSALPGGMSPHNVLLLFPLMAAWLGPVEDERIIFAAFVVLAIPFCAASIYLEYEVARRQLPDIDRAAVYKWARSANIYSYAAIIVAAAVYTAIQWNKTA
jgi:hypothetical protein